MALRCIYGKLYLLKRLSVLNDIIEDIQIIGLIKRNGSVTYDISKAKEQWQTKFRKMG